MTLSIEVLPAPFGPMIARISPLRTSNDTSAIAFTPPNASDTLSTERIASPAAIALPVGDLMWPSPSRRLLHRLGGHRIDFHVPNRDARRKRALAAVLEGDLGGDVGQFRAVIERADQRAVALRDQPAPYFHGPGEFAVVGVEFLVQHQEALDLRARHHLFVDQRLVYLVDMLFQH